MKKCVKPDVITVHSFRLPTLRERVEEHTRDGMDTLYICPDAWVLRYRFVNRETGETIRARLFAGLGLDGTSEIEIDDSCAGYVGHPFSENDEFFGRMYQVG